MARKKPLNADSSPVPARLKLFVRNRVCELGGIVLLASAIMLALSLASWSVNDPSLNHAVDTPPANWLGYPGAITADMAMQLLGLAVIVLLTPAIAWGTLLLSHRTIDRVGKRLLSWLVATLLGAGMFTLMVRPSSWPLPTGLGGLSGDLIGESLAAVLGFFLGEALGSVLAGLALSLATASALCHACLVDTEAVLRLARLFGDGTYEAVERIVGGISHLLLRGQSLLSRGQRQAFITPAPIAMAAGSGPMLRDEAPERGMLRYARSAVEVLRKRMSAAGAGYGDDDLPEMFVRASGKRLEPLLVHAYDGLSHGTEADNGSIDGNYAVLSEDYDEADGPSSSDRHMVTRARAQLKPGRRARREAQPSFPFAEEKDFELPPLALLAEPKQQRRGADLTDDALQQNARMLEGVLDDFGVRGQIIQVRPGPVVTLYELEPAPGIKSSRVIGLADDIARSMSAISARVAVVPGRNVIGIELPNSRRETVYLRELLASEAFEKTNQDLALALGKNIGGEPVFADLARMPHLLIAGTTGSGKSVGINTMILSLLYRLPPDKCRLIMIDPKMLELSIYEGIPHLLTPVVTDPHKAVIALKWAVREMEDRYRKMSKVGVRNIDGFNSRVEQAQRKGESLTRVVQTGFDPETGEPIYEQEEMPLAPLPFIVVIVDEMADLMMVAGKEIEGAIQRLAQMARAAGIHLIMATQRPSVDVITGTIKANFPTRISFQVTSKIDSRTILGEQGAEQLLGQGDMLYMAGGGRITRLHGAFVSDQEVESIVDYLKSQGAPEYLQDITEEIESDSAAAPMDDAGPLEDSDDIYAQAVAVVLRDRKASTSYIQRRLQIGYNRAASLVERMEQEGIISPANHAGKRMILVGEGRDAED
ncbi:DNA translocase FtsK [Rhodoligotrophos defluvii]|uniref:DNA translocase FtsK n=1 Tax=Rhodoligotrophos defluvii TaxID=2561934 RepID=UPI0010C96463|nr:DNA translocase FtsK [Rhodoligotrophos defluvii]